MYCTTEDIQKQVSRDTLIQLTDDNQLGDIDSEIVQESIFYAETLINGYLLGRYNLPVVSFIPNLLKILSIDLSIYRLYSRRFQTDIPDSINEKYKNSVKILEQIQKGIICLEIEATGKVIRMDEYRTNKTAKDRLFSKEFLDDY